MKKYVVVCLTFVVILLLLSINASACKDIIATGDATEGDYNLLLKVRDPSRPGLQVLTIVPAGYQYDYHNPKTGKTIAYATNQRYIGVATQGDVIPDVVKPGMALSESGIAYGDADSGSGWVNYRRSAWDDFDWIRYACQQATTEDEAVQLLTKDVVDEMHAPGVSENLFVVGPNTGYVIEADAYRYDVKEVKNDVAVMSNYPKELWKTQKLDRFTVSKNFDTVVEKTVRKSSVVRLGGLYGIKIVSINDTSISVKPVSLLHKIMTGSIGVTIEIPLGYAKTVGYFRVAYLGKDGRKAHITVSNIYKAWEDELLKKIIPMNGSISVSDMMYLSRLNEDDMDGLRPMCEDSFEYEGVAIYKIPEENYDTLSMGWFSPNHACSSIYVPFHICDTDIYDPYKTGEAAQLSLDLLNVYGNDYLSDSFHETEKVFLNEIGSAEKALSEKNDTSDFLTAVDTGMQKQAYLTQKMWLEASKHSDKEAIIRILDGIWQKDYETSLSNMKNAISRLEPIPNSEFFINTIKDIALDVNQSKNMIYGKASERQHERYISISSSSSNVLIYLLLLIVFLAIVVVFVAIIRKRK